MNTDGDKSTMLLGSEICLKVTCGEAEYENTDRDHFQQKLPILGTAAASVYFPRDTQLLFFWGCAS